jgi:hypothetical protein
MSSSMIENPKIVSREEWLAARKKLLVKDKRPTRPMCPVCFSGVAWLITGGVSVLGATAGGVAIVRDRKIATRISKIWKLRTREPLPSGLVFRGLKTNIENENSK